LKARLEHERSLVEMEHKHKEAMKPEPKPEKSEPAAKTPNIENHIHLPPSSMKVQRGPDGKIAGLKVGGEKE
jgi:hypothetical protein